MNSFEKDRIYEIYAQGFPEPVIGKIVDQEVSEGDILLVIEQADGKITNVWVKAITGWSIVKKRDVAA